MKRSIKIIISIIVFFMIMNIVQITSYAANKVIVLDPGHGRTRCWGNKF